MYTVKQLASLAGITPRTLHHYDQIGLLKPSRLGDNGYRYYGEEALLRLQQILLYRELDMPLEQIRLILERRDFDVLSALRDHKDELRKRAARIERLIATVEDTILHLQGKKEMSDKQLFEPFNEEQQAEYEKEAMRMYDPEIVRESNRKWKSLTREEKQRIGKEGNTVYLGFLNAIDKGPASSEALACVAAWRKHMDYFWTPNVEQLLGLADLYNEDPRFKANFDKIDSRLAGFVREAVKVYVRNLQKK